MKRQRETYYKYNNKIEFKNSANLKKIKMKKLVYLMASIILFSIFSCDKKEECLDCLDNSTSNKGQPVMLKVNLVDVSIRTKASEDQSNPSADREKQIKNHTLFIFNSKGDLDVPPFYVGSGALKAEVLITSNAKEVWAVANGGDPTDDKTFLGKLLAGQHGTGYKSKLITIETSLEDHKVDGLIRSGASKIVMDTQDDGSIGANVVIGLKFVAAKIITNFTISPNNPNLTGAKVIKTYIINGRSNSHVFAKDLILNGDNDDPSKRNWGDLWDTPLKNYAHGRVLTGSEIVLGYRYMDNGVKSDLLINEYAGGGIATPGNTADYFYVLENKAGNVNPHANTLLVYEVLFSNDPLVDPTYRGRTRCYTVNFTGKYGTSTPSGYSIKRGTCYKVNATLYGNGKDTPLEVDATLQYTIDLEDWVMQDNTDVTI